MRKACDADADCDDDSVLLNDEFEGETDADVGNSTGMKIPCVASAACCRNTVESEDVVVVVIVVVCWSCSFCLWVWVWVWC